MNNRWAEPEGFEQTPSPVRYRIRDEDGAVVEHETSVTYDRGRDRFYHSLGPDDQPFADEIVDLIQAACSHFTEAEGEAAPLEGVPDVQISDEEVTQRIERLEQGENTREAERMKLEHYPLTELPFERQRALVELIEAVKERWQFEVIGEVEQAEAA